MACDPQPTTVIVLPDPQLSGAHNILSATSQAGPCTPQVIVDDDNLGTFEPQIIGTPSAPTDPDVELMVVGTGSLTEAGFAFRAVASPVGPWRGSDDGRRLHRSYAHFTEPTHPNIDPGGTAAVYVPDFARILTTAVDTVADEIRVAYRAVDGDYDSWTEYGVDPEAVGGPPLDTGMGSGDHRFALAVLANGWVVLGYLYRQPQFVTQYALALLYSTDGGLTWAFLRDAVLDRINPDYAIRLTVSGNWLRADAIGVGGAPRRVVSTASADNGISWSAKVTSTTLTAPEPGGVGDPLPFAVVGLGGGSYLLATTSIVIGASAWRIAAATKDSAWTGVGGTVDENRTVPGLIRGIGGCVSNGRAYILVSYDGATPNERLGLYYHPIAGAVGAGPNYTIAPGNPPATSWQLVEPLAAYIGDRFLPIRVELVPCGQYLLVYGGSRDNVDATERVFHPVVQIGGVSRQSYGNLEPGDRLTSSSTADNSEPLFQIQWQQIEGRPAGGSVAPGGATSPTSLWVETTIVAPTVTFTPRELNLVTGAIDAVYYSRTERMDNYPNSWILNGSTLGAVVRCNSGSSQAALMHGLIVWSTTTATDEVEFELRIDTLGVTVYDRKALAVVATIATDMTQWVELRIRLEAPLGPVYNGTIVAFLVADYFAAPVTADFVLTSALAPNRQAPVDADPQDRIAWGAPGPGTGNSDWREVWVSEFVTNDRATFDNDTDLLGLPLTDRVYLTGGLSVIWGGGSGVEGDLFVTDPCFTHAAALSVADDTSLIGWRSVDDVSGVESVSFVADPDDADARFVHDMVVVAGIEDEFTTVFWDDNPAFSSPVLSTLTSILFATLDTLSTTGNTLTLAPVPSTRHPLSGELEGMRIRFTSGALNGQAFRVLRHCDDTLTLSGDVSTAVVGDNLRAFAPFAFGVAPSVRAAYMRVAFPSQTTATGDHRLGWVMGGCRVDVPFPLEWTHEDAEVSSVAVFAGPFSDHAQRIGANRRRWTGRLVNDYQGWRDTFRHLLRSLASYEARVCVFIPDEDELLGMIRGRIPANPHENSFWFDRDDGDGTYRRAGGDLRIDVLEVP